MKLDKNTKILIVGLGQIGGSYAQALTSQGYEVGAVDTDPESIDYALKMGWIRHGHSMVIPEYVSWFDLIVFALYPHSFIQWIRENQPHIKSGALLTDVTGVKESVVYTVQNELRKDLEYIGAHPMAGREVSGVKNANKESFRCANYIVTPTDNNTEAAIETCKDLGRILGFRRISVLSPGEHDEIIGFLSQLTHCIAVSLMLCNDSKALVDYTGDSFRDLTRIAKINDEMWSELFLLNKEKLLAQMELFEKNFAKLKDSIACGDGDTVRKYMRISTQRRKRFDKGRDAV